MEHLRLSELIRSVKDTLNDHLDPSYWVVAEISEIKINQKGHCYLELSESADDIVIARVRATIWSYTYRNISGWFEKITGRELAQGMKVLANAQVNFHELYGFSLNIKDIDASFTLGEKAKQRQLVIDRLVKDGVFDMNKQLDLPLVPQNISLISSETAAGYEDFMNQLESNGHRYRFNVNFYPAVMQGEQAARSIITALLQVHQEADSDLVMIVRGGGAQSDLDCFDEYELCAHIAQFPLPVITGIGHERDETVADLVAHTKIKTPTAAAEFLIQGLAQFEESLMEVFTDIGKTGRRLVQLEMDRATSMSNGLNQIVSRYLVQLRQTISSYQSNITSWTRQSLLTINRELTNLEQKIGLLNPVTILNRGYTLTYFEGRPLDNVSLNKGDSIITISKNHSIESTVIKQKGHAKNEL